MKIDTSMTPHDDIADIMSADDIALFKATGEIDPPVYDVLFNFFLTNGDMPYGTAKARTGDPHEWIENRLFAEFADQ